MRDVRLLKHAAYNMLGLGLPMLVAVFTIPVLIRQLGEARFGLLTLIWAVVSYFGFFDLGLGRALTQDLARSIARGEIDRIGKLVATSTALLCTLGIVAGGLMAGGAGPAVDAVRAGPARDEALYSMLAMAVGMPAIVMTSGFRGILEATHRFGIINVIRLPMGVYTFVAPVGVALVLSPRLDWIAWALVAGRILGCVVHGWYAWRALPPGHGALRVELSLVKPLCVSGGWLTVSSVVSPFMGYIDRFILGAAASLAAVSYYVTPHELITKLWIIPGALTTVLFPRFAALKETSAAETWQLFRDSTICLFIVLLPVSASIGLFAQEILAFWISPAFADHSAVLLQIFAVGILINCLAHVPLTLLQSVGAAKITAVVHAVELPLYTGLLLLCASTWGAVGAAMAWLCRILLDAAAMFLMCAWVKGWPFGRYLPYFLVSIGCLVAGVMSGVLVHSFPSKSLVAVLILVAAIFMLHAQWRDITQPNTNHG